MAVTGTPQSDTNPCILLHGPHKSSLSTTHLPLPTLNEYPSDHVLLQIAYIGVCGSDVHFYTHGGVGSDTTKYAQHQGNDFLGLVMGHEASATVLEVGKQASTLQAGDSVAIEPGIPCRTCPRCAEGMYNLCPDMHFAASFHTIRDPKTQSITTGTTPGTLCKYYVLPESLCYKLPSDINLQEGVLVEPLAVAVHAARMVGINPVTVDTSKSLVVFGVGTVGILSAAVACAFGAGKVVIVDIDRQKLEFAKTWLGSASGAATRAGAALHTIQSEIGVSPADTARQIMAGCGLKAGADYVIEASGAPSATATGIHVLRSGGSMVQTGLAKKPAMDAFPIVDLSEKEIHLHGAFRYKIGDFATAVDVLRRGLVGPVGELISKVFEFKEYEEAWKATRDGGGKGTKNLIKGPE
ncbi:hypothetical protein H2198_004065 [Neophaeococcomyces mojaviensis]|uniref:Uncharacterized protein n=1 Tax=Neophaeococcomyces mojaviensis TaxID=3383035 RepID=A0ACC3A9Q0_9EURO|nr:hypothetical protein H2198_004065 [Knufia sp. JES_112]